MQAKQVEWEKQFKSVVPWTNLEIKEAKSKSPDADQAA